MTRLTDFYDQLERHDWFYSYADDSRAYRNGRQRQKELEVIAAESPAHEALYDAFKAHMFNGPAWDTPYVQRPEAPTHD